MQDNCFVFLNLYLLYMVLEIFKISETFPVIPPVFCKKARILLAVPGALWYNTAMGAAFPCDFILEESETVRFFGGPAIEI